MGGFREVAVVKMLHIADVGKGDSGAVSADDISHMVLLICPQRAGAEAEAVVFVIHHGEEAADGFLVHQKSWKAENVPWGIVLMDCHFDAGLPACGHNGLQKILEILPEPFLGHGLVFFKKLVQLLHAFGLPAGEGQSMEVFQNVLCHFLIIVLNLGLFVK